MTSPAPAAPEVAHTWTPVRLIEGKTLFALLGSDDREIALLNIWSEATYGQTKDMARERGEHIVHAVNSHAALMAIAREVASLGPGKCVIGHKLADMAREAIRIAEERS